MDSLLYLFFISLVVNISSYAMAVVIMINNDKKGKYNNVSLSLTLLELTNECAEKKLKLYLPEALILLLAKITRKWLR